MTYHGHVENGVVVLDDTVSLPDGTRVQVEVFKQIAEEGPLGEALLQFSGVVKDLPSDMAKNHDHYLHGRPRQ
jgi:hypothetical protein